MLRSNGGVGEREKKKRTKKKRRKKKKKKKKKEQEKKKKKKREKKEWKEGKGKINDEKRGVKTVEKRKSRNVPPYPRMGKDVTKRKERWRVERRERKRKKEREGEIGRASCRERV